MHKFWKKALIEFPKRMDFENFKNWPEVRAVPLYIERDYVDGYYNDVKEMIPLSSNKEKWNKILLDGEPKLGHTDESLLRAEFIFEEKVRTTGFRLKSMHHALTFETLSQKSFLDYNMIIEFGAGIGDLARTIFDLGYNKRYIIVDFPQISRIASFYNSDRVDIVDSIGKISWIPPKTLFIATWSLSEIQFNQRKIIADKIKNLDQLIVFQKDFYDIDNFSYFTQEWPLLTNTFIRMKKIWFHEHQGGSFYLIARKIA